MFRDKTTEELAPNTFQTFNGVHINYKHGTLVINHQLHANGLKQYLILQGYRTVHISASTSDSQEKHMSTIFGIPFLLIGSNNYTDR